MWTQLADQYQIINKRRGISINLHIYCTCIIFSGAEPLYVSKSLQKAKIVVNEDGTKAAAATSEYLYSEPCLGL